MAARAPRWVLSGLTAAHSLGMRSSGLRNLGLKVCGAESFKFSAGYLPLSPSAPQPLSNGAMSQRLHSARNLSTQHSALGPQHSERVLQHPALGAQHSAQSFRWFSKGSGKKGKGGKGGKGAKVKVSEAEKLKEQLKQEILYADFDGDVELDEPPAGWEIVQLDEHIGAGESGSLMLQKKSQGEMVSILTSTELLATDDDYDVDYQDEIEGDNDSEDVNFHPPFALLVALKKDGTSKPLYIECIVEGFQPRISRVSVGSGTVGYLCNVYGPITYLYQTYSAVSEDNLIFGKIIGPETTTEITDEDIEMDLAKHTQPGYVSPPFAELPLEVQEWLSEHLQTKIGPESIPFIVEVRGSEAAVVSTNRDINTQSNRCLPVGSRRITLGF